MNYLSVCSGIEAATVAWHPLGWTPVAFSEIEPFPCSLLAHHYPDVPNLGDMTRFDEWPEEMLAKADILVGGTPCQAFSVAGNRNSLNDHRGNLTLIYANLLDRIDSIRIRLQLPPAVCVWENVPGVLSTKDNAFGCFLAELAGEDAPLQPPGGRWTDAGLVCGPKRAVAWRILDAQYFGLAQRRRRVFLVAGAGEGFDPSQVLFEFQGLRRDSAPSREAREGTSRDASIRTGGSHLDAPKLPHPSLNQSHNTGGIGASNQELFSQRGAGLVPVTVGALTNGAHNGGELNGQDANSGRIIPVCMATGQASAEIGIGIGTTLNCNHEAPIVAFDLHQVTSPDNRSNPQPGDPCQPLANHAESPVVVGALTAKGPAAKGSPEVDAGHYIVTSPPSLTFNAVDYKDGTFAECDAAGPLTTSPDRTRSAPVVAGAMAVRRLTPRECERLQGFPDDYTIVPHRGKPAADGPRYKALGNSKAVPVVRWIGRRLDNHLNHRTP